MPPSHPFGPRSPAVEAFLAELDSIRWFSRAGSPLPDPAQAESVDFEFILANHGDPWKPWGQSLLAAEAIIWDEVIRQQLLAEQARLQEAAGVRGDAADDFLVALDEQFDNDYVGDTCMYAHEIAPSPDRLIRGAAYEVLIGRSGFFLDVFPWFRQGRFPVGWRGSWPEGTLLVW